MNKLENRLAKLEKPRDEELIGVFFDYGDGTLEDQRQKFMSKHGRPPTNEIVVEFV